MDLFLILLLSLILSMILQFILIVTRERAYSVIRRTYDLPNMEGSIFGCIAQLIVVSAAWYFILWFSHIIITLGSIPTEQRYIIIILFSLLPWVITLYDPHEPWANKTGWVVTARQAIFVDGKSNLKLPFYTAAIFKSGYDQSYYDINIPSNRQLKFTIVIKATKETNPKLFDVTVKEIKEGIRSTLDGNEKSSKQVLRSWLSNLQETYSGWDSCSNYVRVEVQKASITTIEKLYLEGIQVVV